MDNDKLPKAVLCAAVKVQTGRRIDIEVTLTTSRKQWAYLRKGGCWIVGTHPMMAEYGAGIWP